MSKSNKPCLALIALFVLVGSALAQAKSSDPLNDPDVQKVLRGMADASTWYHPDLFGEFAGMRRYAHHDYAGALKYLKIGAYYSDKLSALSIGLMYLNGEGVARDPVTAYAWLSVAAERGYPDFVATRDRVKAMLTAEQLLQAHKALANLTAEYGDKVAKRRLVMQLRQGQMQITGSHTGFDSGIVQLRTGHCSGPAVEIGGEPMPKTGCGGNVYAKWRWDPKTYFAVRDSHWKATVSVGAIDAVGAAIDKDKSGAGKKLPGDSEQPSAAHKR
jgi:hypothetical protein